MKFKTFKISRYGEASAHYNLGNIFHAKAISDEPFVNFPALKDAMEHYKHVVTIATTMDDQMNLIGKAWGNVGNAHYR